MAVNPHYGDLALTAEKSPHFFDELVKCWDCGDLVLLPEKSSHFLHIELNLSLGN